MLTLPNLLTGLRIALIPFFAVCFYLPGGHAPLLAAAVFGLAAGTDWLDGYLARRLEQTSALGAFLDPVADKLMVSTVLVVLLQARPTVWLALPVAVIIGREIAVSALREWMSEMGARRKVAVSWLGKVKTVLQMVALVFLILAHDAFFPDICLVLGGVLIYAAAIMTLWSMWDYLRLAWPELSRG
ncbi:MAG: CDP-diacylglycerol--glycerol-3-phosphate 3-phosphatidyltransferase [Gammaproteobacteria bacterium]|jgi:CDP-diacylglycerol--glycerol-3-phosphate 3-phosphatidyltransferase